jgi:chemotaxis protein methyltransferase CheR
MKDAECRSLLEWALPELGLRPEGFRKVRQQVCKRVARRMRLIDAPDLGAYRRRLEADPGERAVFDSFCRITISRFARDWPVFSWLEHAGLPGLARRAIAEHRQRLACWSAGCASGEEPYTLAIIWELEISQQPRGSICRSSPPMSSRRCSAARARVAIRPQGPRAPGDLA